MKKFIVLIFVIFYSAAFSQKKKNLLDVVSNVEVKVIAMKPIGNNTFAKNLKPFYGFAFGGNLMTPINFGIGADYSVLFSNVVHGKQNVYGSSGSPTLKIIDVFATHRDIISEDFMVEESAGASHYTFSNTRIYGDRQKINENAFGYHLAGKAIYTLDGAQQVFATAKVNFYLGKVYNENPETERFYSKSTFLSFAFGYRYNF